MFSLSRVSLKFFPFEVLEILVLQAMRQPLQFSRRGLSSYLSSFHPICRIPLVSSSGFVANGKEMDICKTNWQYLAPWLSLHGYIINHRPNAHMQDAVYHDLTTLNPFPMKPIYFAGFALCIFLASCCHKAETPSPSTVPANTWSYSWFRFSQQSSSRDSIKGVYQLVFFPAGATATNEPSITFGFSKSQQSAGMYKIVGYPRADNELSIFCSSGSGEAYYRSTGNDGATAQLSFTNGKLSLYCDKVVMKQDLFVGGDSTTLSFNLSEYW